MNKAIYYHNPKCSKSRAGLALLEENGLSPKIYEYLKEGLTKIEVLDLIKKTGKKPTEGFVRLKETVAIELNLKDSDKTLEQWALVISENPILLERPILVIGDKAIIGRPPKDLLQII